MSPQNFTTWGFSHLTMTDADASTFVDWLHRVFVETTPRVHAQPMVVFGASNTGKTTLQNLVRAAFANECTMIDAADVLGDWWRGCLPALQRSNPKTKLLILTLEDENLATVLSKLKELGDSIPPVLVFAYPPLLPTNDGVALTRVIPKDEQADMRLLIRDVAPKFRDLVYYSA